jgi:hypothetical protein
MATTDFWNGTGNWTTNGADWSDGTPPVPTEAAEIQTGTDALTATSTITALQVDAPATLQLNTGAVLTDTGLAAIAGALFLQNGGSVSTTGGLSVTGNGFTELDGPTIGGNGGSRLTIGGTLTDSSTNGNAFDIGNTGIVSGDTVTAIALNNTGAIYIGGSGTVQSTLNITSGPAGFGTIGVETGSVYLQNDALQHPGQRHRPIHAEHHQRAGRVRYDRGGDRIGLPAERCPAGVRQWPDRHDRWRGRSQRRQCADCRCRDSGKQQRADRA